MAESDTTTSAKAEGDKSEADLTLVDLFEPRQQDICPFGDVVLLVDNDFHPTQKIRVST